MEAYVKEDEDENDYVANYRLREQSSPVRTMILINHDDRVNMCFAQGCKLIFYERNKGVTTELQVFPENIQITKIHNYNSNRLLVLGKSMARIVYLTYTKGYRGLGTRWIPKLFNNVFELGEWTKAAAFLNDTKIACLNACNNLKTYNLKMNELQDIELERSSSYNLEVPEIYTGEIYVQYEEINGEYKSKMQDVVVCGGTVFGQVYIWTIDYNDKAKILHRVNAHEGPVYSGLYPGGLTTAGDDRAGTCYRFSMDLTNSKPMDNVVDNANQCRLIKSRFDVYGHQARGYQVLFAAPWLITSSEDSHICLWRRQQDDEDSWVLQKKMVSGAGSPVRALVYDEVHKLLYIGADNGSVQVWNISSSLAMPIDIVQLYPGEQDSFNNDILNWGNPKSVVAWSSKINVAIIQDKRTAVIVRQLNDISYAKLGVLKGWDKDESGKFGYTGIQLLEAWDDHKCDNPFSMGLSPKRKYFASGSTEFGEVAVREILSDPDPFKFRVISYNRFREKLCSLVFASESVCILSTSTRVYKADLAENNSETQAEWELLKIYNSVIISAAVIRDFIVLGDEKGVLTVLKKTGEILNIYNKWHTEFGLSSLISYNGRIISTGRDSLVKCFTINNDGEITDFDVIRTPFDWIDRTVHFFDDLLCAAFKETKFMLFSMKAKEVVYEVDCGGAHRSYDFVFHYEDDDNDYDYQLDTSPDATTDCTDGIRISLSYVRDAKINRITDQLCNWLNPVKKASVTKKINCGVAILAEDKESYFVITGSDDNVITIFEYFNENSTLCLRQDLIGHVSTVVCLKYVACAKKRRGGLLFSGGGRSELIVWRIKPGKKIWYRQLKSIQLMEHLNSKHNNSNLDFRVLDIQVKILLGLYFIFASCSDGHVYVLYYDEDKRDLKKIAVLQPELMHLHDKYHAITKIHLGQVIPDTTTFNVFGCCTSGHLIVWNFDANGVLNEYGYYDDENILKNTVYQLSTFHTRLSSTPITAMLHLGTTKEFVKLVLGYESGRIEIVDLHYEDNNQFRIDRLGANETIHSEGILSIEFFHDTKSLRFESEEELMRGRFGTFIVSSVDQIVSVHHVDTGIYEMKSAIRDCQAFVFLPRSYAGIFLGDGLSLFDNLELKLDGRYVLKALDISRGYEFPILG